jgi:hypothetical protein
MQALAQHGTTQLAGGQARSARRRAWALLLTLALVVASFMHVAHTHDADAKATYKLCSFCTTLDRGGAPPPAVAQSVPQVSAVATAILDPIAAPAGTVCRTPLQPRAPPALLA